MYIISLLDPLQIGFRRGNNTQTALVKLTNNIRLAIDRRMVTLLVLFDFSNASVSEKEPASYVGLTPIKTPENVLPLLKEESDVVGGAPGLQRLNTTTEDVPLPVNLSSPQLFLRDFHRPHRLA